MTLCLGRTVLVRGLISFLLVGFAQGLAPSARGAVPPETLLPSQTVAFVSIPNLQRFDEACRRTQLSGLFNDPAMRAFRNSLENRIRERLVPEGETLSLSWADIVGTPSGEVTVAVLHPAPGTKAAVLLMDVTGRAQEASDLLDDIQQEFISHKATQETTTIAGVNVVVFKLPPVKDRDRKRFPEAIFFLQNDYLVGADNREAAAAMISSIKAPGKDTLSNHPSFKYVMTAAARQAGASTGELRWYLDPFGFAEAQQIVIGGTVGNRDVLKILRKQGFDALKAVGGLVAVADGTHEVLHHTAIHAPGFNEGNPSFRLAAKALQLRNTVQDQPPAWVPRDLAGCTLVNVDIATGFEHVGTLIDEWYKVSEDDNQKFFQNLLDDLAKDPAGAKVDLRSDVIAHLGTKVTIMGDVAVGAEQELTESERNMLAIEAKNEAALTTSIHRLLEADGSTEKHVLGGVTLWEVKPQTANTRPGRTRPRPGASRPGSKPAPSRQPVPLKVSSGVAVARGHLFFSSHYDLLVRVLTSKEPPLAESADFQVVNTELARLGASRTCVRGFVRRDEANFGNYKLLQQGKMPESKTILGQALNVLLSAEHAPGASRKPELDGSTLPDYEVIRRYLGPSGTFVVSEAEGLAISGFILPKPN